MSAGRRTPRGAARAKILRTALELFYRGGVQAVGVDTVAERSGVAKVTLYRHFPTKAELVSAVLETADAQYLSAYRNAMEAAGEAPQERVGALFEALDRLAQTPAYRGCIFINAGLALADTEHPARERVRRHKDALRGLLADELRAAGHADPECCAEELLLLVDGALVAGVLRSDSHPAQAARRLAERIFD